MSQESEKLQDLVKLIETGNEFYQHVKGDIDDAELAAFCDANLDDRRRALDRLRAALVNAGMAEEGFDLEARLEQDRADLLSAVQVNYVHIYLDHLEDLEEKTQQALREAIVVAESSDIRTLLQKLEPEWQQIHDRMRAAREKSANRETPKTIPTRLMR